MLGKCLGRGKGEKIRERERYVEKGTGGREREIKGGKGERKTNACEAMEGEQNKTVRGLWGDREICRQEH